MCAAHKFQAPESPFPEHFLLTLLAVPRLEAVTVVAPCLCDCPGNDPDRQKDDC